MQDEATMLRMDGGKAARRMVRRWWSPEAGEDGAVAADPRRPGRTGQVGQEAACVLGADSSGPAAWHEGGGEGVGGFREADGGGESRGAEDGGHRGSGGRVG
jgi:hypothetical protein